jgi:serine protease AprX
VNVRVADSQGQAQTSDIIAGLNWILQNENALHIGVVNMSLGSASSATIAFDPIDQAVEQLWLNGIVVVVAAGNAGLPNAPVPIGSPANDPFVITVGALDLRKTTQTTDDFRAPWSSYGTTDDGFAKPELSAPGRYMVEPVPNGSLLTTQHKDRLGKGNALPLDAGYMWMSGTSFAAPIVSGAAAQVLAFHPNWTPDQVKGALMDTASPIARGSASVGTGAGEVNAAAAVGDVLPGNPNAGLDAWVTTDPVTGSPYFDAGAWHDDVNSTTSNWVTSNWVRTVGVSSNWVRSNWVASNWVASNWVQSNWVSTSFVQSMDAE